MEKATSAGRWKYIDEPLKERMKKNTVTNLLFFVLTLPIVFIMTPMILKFTGKEQYGIWAITGTLLVFLEFLGLQTPTAVGIIVPKFDLKKQADDVNRLINTLFVFYLGAAVAAALVYLAVQGLLIKAFFNTSAGLLDDVRFVVGISVLFYLVNFVMLSFAYLLGGLNIFYPANILHIIIGWLRLGAMAAVLFAGYGIKGIAVVQGASIALETAVLNLWLKAVYPPLRFNPMLFDMKTLGDIIGLSVRLLLTRLSVVVTYNIDKMVLGFLLNPVIVAYYQIGSSISRYISTVPDMLSTISLIPAAAELKARNQHEKIRNLYVRINRYIFFISIFLTAGILLFGREFTGLWLGPGYEQVYTVMVFLSLAYCASLLGVPAMHILNGMELVNLPMMIAGCTAALNLALSFLLALKYGLTGALTGTAVAAVAGSAAMYVVLRKEIGIGVNFADIMLKPVLSALLAAVLFILIRWPSAGWLLFFAKTAAFTAIYGCVSIFVLRQFDQYDMQLLSAYLPFKKKMIENAQANTL